MMKKTLLKLNTILLIMVLILSFTLCAKADTVLEEGDRVVFGKYMDSPLSWRVYSKEDGKIILISDKIITTKAYHSKNALWETSSIRDWLNSSAGFLSEANFTTAELAMFTTHTVEYAVNPRITGITTQGSEEHIYNSRLKEVMENYHEAYRYTSTDKVFVPGICDVYHIGQNPQLFGVDGYLATDINSTASYADYWLRDSMYGLDTNVARCMTKEGRVSYETVTATTHGVRPMCALSEELVGISSGNGTESSPYVLSDSDYLVLSTENDAVWTDGSLSIRVLGKGTSEGNVSIFRNGEEITDYTDNVAVVKAFDGVNVFNAYVYDENGTPKMISEPVSVWGQSYETQKVKYSWNFDETTPFKETQDQMVTWTEEDGKSGKGIGITSFDQTQGTVSSVSLDKNKTAVLIDVDIKFNTIDVLQNQPIRVKLMPQGEFYMPITVNTGGYVYLNGTENSFGSLVKLNENQWYNFKVVINDTENTVSLAIDGVVYAKDEPMTTSFDYATTLLMSASWNNTGRSNKICIDNLNVTNVEAGNLGLDMFHIVHPDQKSLTAVGINNTDSAEEVSLVASSFDETAHKETQLTHKEMPPRGFAWKEFSFNAPLDAKGYFRIFMFDDIMRLKPAIKSQKSE